MMPKPLDRRVRRTRRLLHEALLALVLEKDFDALTITEITERAGLRRATFYLHYATKEELLLSALEQTFDELVEKTRHATGGDVIAGKTQADAYRVTFEHVAENVALYRALFAGSGGGAVNQRIREYLAGLVLNSLKQISDANLPMPRAVLAHFIAGAELSLILWWLGEDMPYSTETMAEMTYRLVLDGVRGTLGAQLVSAPNGDKFPR